MVSGAALDISSKEYVEYDDCMYMVPADPAARFGKVIFFKHYYI